jgi:predicted nucleotidyltransferase
MSRQQPFPTRYPDINAVLSMVLSGARAILEDRFVGLYLYGSLACGHFDRQSSDIDFLVVTTEELAEDVVTALANMHACLADESRWAKELDGDYIPAGMLRRHDPARSRYPHLGWGGVRLRVEGHGSDAVIMRHLLREWGMTVAGPPPRTLIDPVSPAELRQAVRALAREWWVPAIDDPARLSDPHHLIYAVLTMCRLLYTVEHGAIVPKPVAAQWAQQALEARWRPLVARAATREVRQTDLGETRHFLQYALDLML